MKLFCDISITYLLLSVSNIWPAVHYAILLDDFSDALLTSWTPSGPMNFYHLCSVQRCSHTVLLLQRVLRRTSDKIENAVNSSPPLDSAMYMLIGVAMG